VISTTLLLSRNRIPRFELRGWAARLKRQLERCLGSIRGRRDFALEVAGVSNNAALIATHMARPSLARSLCERQIYWQHRLSRRARDKAIAAHGLQPWINLGRLDALLGRWETALTHFTRLNALRTAGRIHLGSVCLDVRRWEAVAPSRREFEHFLENIYVLDTLKALISNRRFEDALIFPRQVAPEGRVRLAPQIAEAGVVAHGGLGEFQQAHDLAAEFARLSRGWDRAIFRIRQAETLACAGEGREAAAVLLPLARVVGQLSTESTSDPSALMVVGRLAGVCREVGLDETAGGIALKVHEGACAVGDEAVQIESLRILAAVSPASEISVWEETLARAEKSTGYTRYRRGVPAPPDPMIARLFEQLDEVFAS
jgi:hypothetical protein